MSIIQELKLNEGNSMVKIINTLPQEIQVDNALFTRLWNLHPQEYGQVKIFGKEIATPRWQQTYGRNYKFSGMDHKALPIDDPYFKLLMEWVNQHSGKQYNQCLVNWYKDGDHYIGAHSDDESQLEPNSDIYSFSFGSNRTFIITSKKDKQFKTKLIMNDNSLIIMCGEMQKYYKHAVPKTKVIVGQRINITFRLFKD